MCEELTEDRLQSTGFNGCEISNVFNDYIEYFYQLSDLTDSFLSTMTQVKVIGQLNDQNAI